MTSFGYAKGTLELQSTRQGTIKFMSQKTLRLEFRADSTSRPSSIAQCFRFTDDFPSLPRATILIPSNASRESGPQSDDSRIN